jgi:radical SAM protein with 4Fe4S-binding SPASM domain
MIRISRIIHGKRTMGDLIKRRPQQKGRAPLDGHLAFSSADFPVVFWNITGQCNLACSYCYLGAGEKLSDELTTGECYAVIDDLSGAGVPLLIISGGEPLVRKDIDKILAYAQEKKVKTALSSNGTLIDRRAALRLQELGVEYVGISLDGATAATHDHIRGIPGSFHRSLDGLRECVSARLPCGIRMTLTKENRDEIFPLIDLALRLSVPRFCLYWLVPSGRGSREYLNKQISAEDAMRIFENLCSRARQIDPKTLEILTVDAPQDSIQLLSFLKREQVPGYDHAFELLRRQGYHCSAGERIVNIDPCGNVYPCQFAQSPEFLLGNVRDSPFSELWKGEKNSAIRLFHQDVEIGCSTCPSYNMCRGGCHIRAHFSANGDRICDPFCPLVPPKGR